MGVLGKFWYLLFPAFVLSEVARVQVTPFIGIALLDIVITLLAFFYLISLIIKKNFSLPIWQPILLVITVFTLSLVLNSFILKIDQLFYSSLYLFRWTAYALFLLFALNSRKNIKSKIERYMILSGASIVTVGLLQFLFFKDLKVLFFLGWDDHLYRLFSTFLDPNFAGMFLVLFLLFQLPYLLKSLQEVPLLKKFLFTFLFILTSLAIFLTYSRTAYLMAIVGVLVYFVLYQKKVYALLAVICIIFGISVFANTKIEGLNPFRTASTLARVESINNSVAIIQENPLFGVGFNAYRYAQIRHGFRDEVTPFPTHADSGTDNSFLFLLSTSGVLGLLIYLYFLFHLWKTAYKRKSFLRNTFLSSFISWGVGSLFINGLFYPEMMFWMWSLYSLTQESL